MHRSLLAQYAWDAAAGMLPCVPVAPVVPVPLSRVPLPASWPLTAAACYTMSHAECR
jgi:hypothetical protein